MHDNHSRLYKQEIEVLEEALRRSKLSNSELNDRVRTLSTQLKRCERLHSEEIEALRIEHDTQYAALRKRFNELLSETEELKVRNERLDQGLRESRNRLTLAEKFHNSHDACTEVINKWIDMNKALSQENARLQIELNDRDHYSFL